MIFLPFIEYIIDNFVNITLKSLKANTENFNSKIKNL